MLPPRPSYLKEKTHNFKYIKTKQDLSDIHSELAQIEKRRMTLKEVKMKTDIPEAFFKDPGIH